jgi:hypothetical protein
MLRLAILSAWAELQIQSTRWDYLVDIISPHIGVLTPLWLATLTDFAKLQFEPDNNDGIVDDMIVDAQYAYASKDFLLSVRALHTYTWAAELMVDL